MTLQLSCGAGSKRSHLAEETVAVDREFVIRCRCLGNLNSPACRDIYNTTSLIEWHGFLTPAKFRQKQLQSVAKAA
jgi:hypothetical protein